MVLHRYVSTYIITYYLPSGLFVIVSWISFLIPMDVIPGRMALLVTLFLVLVNIFNTVTTNTPKAEGLTHSTTLDGGKGKAKGEYSYKSKSKEKSSEGEGKQGAAVIPICLPMCCAAPCVIM